jgi:hypothetical protein
VLQWPALDKPRRKGYGRVSTATPTSLTVVFTQLCLPQGCGGNEGC